MLRYTTAVEQIVEFKAGTDEWRTEGTVEPGGEAKLPAWHPHLKNALLRAHEVAQADGLDLLGRDFVARFDELAPGGARWTLEIDEIDIPPAFEGRQAPWEAWASEAQGSDGSGFDKQAALERLEETGIRPASEEPGVQAEHLGNENRQAEVPRGARERRRGDGVMAGLNVYQQARERRAFDCVQEASDILDPIRGELGLEDELEVQDLPPGSDGASSSTRATTFTGRS